MVETPERALVVMPHPNDGEVWCGGTVARWVKEGSEVYFLLCTDGGKGTTDPEMTPDRLASIREQEQRAGARILGVKELATLGYSDGELEESREFLGGVVRAVRRFRPDVVLCPEIHRRGSPWHRDYRITGQVTADAVYPYARDRLHFNELFVEEGLEPHKAGTVLFWGPDAPDTFVDIGDTVETKIKALLCHVSQASGLPAQEVGDLVRERARQASEGSGYQYGEAFRKIEFRR